MLHNKVTQQGRNDRYTIRPEGYTKTGMPNELDFYKESTKKAPIFFYSITNNEFWCLHQMSGNLSGLIYTDGSEKFLSSSGGLTCAHTYWMGDERLCASVLRACCTSPLPSPPARERPVCEHSERSTVCVRLGILQQRCLEVRRRAGVELERRGKVC